MTIPSDLRYSDEHEWARVEGDTATLGITDYAQDALSDITFVELPDLGRSVAAGEELGAIESCKAAASFYAPLTGEVTAVNEALEDDPGVVNTDPYGEGWICKVKLSDPSAAEKLMDATAYETFCGEQG